LEPLEVIGEPSQERSDLAGVHATEPDGEVLTAYVVWTDPSTRGVSPAHGMNPPLLSGLHGVM
jgi:hypothetical protein